MRISKSSVWAGVFSAAIFGLTGAAGLAAPHIDGTYAAVTSQTVEILTLHQAKRDVSGNYRVMHLNAAAPDGLDDQRIALSSLTGNRDQAFTMDDTRSMLLRFDATFQHAQAITAAVPGSQTQSFTRVTAGQVHLLEEMARYGGLFEVCQARRDQAASAYSREFCATMAPQLTDIVPFRPFPSAKANHPVLAYQVRARLDRSLAVLR